MDWLAVARAAARDLERGKLAEAGHAWGLERGNAKAAILEAYLNTVSFGQGADGVEAAAQAYFSTSADRLTLAQAALLAGLIRARWPTTRSAIPGPTGPAGPRS